MVQVVAGALIHEVICILPTLTFDSRQKFSAYRSYPDHTKRNQMSIKNIKPIQPWQFEDRSQTQIIGRMIKIT